jgi:putative integral membrane protein (TIGR02587 family)
MNRVRARTRRFWIGIARAFSGAILFALPLLMTVEMWSLGSSLPPGRIALFLGLTIPILVGLSYISGFEPTFRLEEDAVDAVIALGVGLAASTTVLALLGLVRVGMPPTEAVGRVALQAVPAAIGAMLSLSQFRSNGDDESAAVEEELRRRESSHGLELFTMGVGALFLALAVAPTGEILSLGYTMSDWMLVALIVVSLVTLHAFVYALDFRGQAGVPEGIRQWSLALRYTVPGYAIALLVSLYVLWTFGRADGLAPASLLAITVVLGFPAAFGAAAARLIL